jgi:hypothetical protein
MLSTLDMAEAKDSQCSFLASSWVRPEVERR